MAISPYATNFVTGPLMTPPVSNMQLDAFFDKTIDHIITIDLFGNKKKIGSFHLLSLLKALNTELTSRFGAPVSFDLVGGAVATIIGNQRCPIDIDFVIQFPEALQEKLPEMKAVVKTALEEFSDPIFEREFLRSRLTGDYYIFSLGDQDSLMIDITVATKKPSPTHEPHRISLISYLKRQLQNT
jgi:hypothetical protein